MKEGETADPEHLSGILVSAYCEPTFDGSDEPDSQQQTENFHFVVYRDLLDHAFDKPEAARRLLEHVAHDTLKHLVPEGMELTLTASQKGLQATLTPLPEEAAATP